MNPISNMSFKELSRPYQDMVYFQKHPHSDILPKSFANTLTAEEVEWEGWIAADSALQSSYLGSSRQIDDSSLYERQLYLMDLAHNTHLLNYPNSAADDGHFDLDDLTISPLYQLHSAPRNDDIQRKQILRGQQSLAQRHHQLHSYPTPPIIGEPAVHNIGTPDYRLVAAPNNIEEEDEVDSTDLVEPPPTQIRASNTKCKRTKQDRLQTGSNNKCRKQAHNAVEKRYRLSLNQKIAELRQHVPSLCSDAATTTKTTDAHVAEGEKTEDTSSTATAASASSKFGKANILTGAIEYISELERGTRQFETEIAGLRARIAAFETLDAASLTFPGDDYELCQMDDRSRGG